MPRILGASDARTHVQKHTITGAASGVLVAVGNSGTEGIGERVWVTRAWMEFTAAAAAACTIDVGFGDSASDVADARSDDLFDGINVETGTLTLDVALDTITLDVAGATATMTPQAWEVDDFLLVHVKTGNGTGLAGTLYIEYAPA